MSIAGIALAVGAALLWGVSYLVAEQVLHELHTSAVMLLGSAFTFTVVAVYIIATDSVTHITGPLQARTVMYALGLCLSNILATTAIYLAIKHLGASVASVFEISYPLFVVLFSYFFFGAKLSGSVIMGALCMIVGAGLIVTSHT